MTTHRPHLFNMPNLTMTPSMSAPLPHSCLHPWQQLSTSIQRICCMSATYRPVCCLLTAPFDSKT